MGQYVLPLEEVGKEDVQRCGGKAVSLGELTRAGAKVPPGFCVVGEALDYLVDSASLGDQISALAATLDFDDFNAVEQKCGEIRALIMSVPIPAALQDEILDRYRELIKQGQYVAVRSSVAVKGTSISSFPGMMDTYHYVLGEEELLEKIQECWASLWTSRAAYSRRKKNIEHHLGIIAPVVQLMVHPDTAGVMFTANPITKNTGEIVIEANWGLGESVVSGKSLNDFYLLDKTTLMVKQQKIAHKTLMITMDEQKGSGRAEQMVPTEQATLPTLSDLELVQLGETGKKIEAHFGFYADIEWAYQDSMLYVLQTRRIPDIE